MEVAANPVLGIFLLTFSALSGALCYTPQKKLRGWSWETYWMTQAAVCWLIGPIIGAMITIPNLGQVLSEASKATMITTFLFGVAYGIGGTAFGLAIKHIGFSLTYAIAIGLSCVVGTFAGPIYTRTLGTFIQKTGGNWIMAGVLVGIIGIALCGLAGRKKEIDLVQDEEAKKKFSLAKGLPLCILAGLLSAVYGIALNFVGKPIADIAAKHGAGFWQTNVIFIFVNSGAFCTTAVYVIWLGIKNRSLGEYIKPKDSKFYALPLNYLLGILTGLMWYGQFLFYGIAYVKLGTFQFSAWAILNIQVILVSSLIGIVLKEWSKSKSMTKVIITIALLVLFVSILFFAYGNWLGEEAAKAAAAVVAK